MIVNYKKNSELVRCLANLRKRQGMDEIEIRFPGFLVVAAALCGCAAPSPTSTDERARHPPEPSAANESPTTPPDSARGGRLFDRWWRFDPTFTPDDGQTAAADGKGGPNADGTLNRRGSPLLNTGHDYRLSRYFGWDLRGSAGIAGPAHQDRPHIVSVDLLADTRTVDDLAAWLSGGDDVLPAFGDVLTQQALADVALFIVETRERTLPHPDEIFSLSSTAPRNYVLNEGADIEAGHASIAAMCSGGFCHGVGGTAIAIDGSYSLGSYSRTKADEAWFKIVNGQPGTAMGRQTDDAGEVLNMLAALCDRETYPPEQPGNDVADGDARCGAYLR